MNIRIEAIAKSVVKGKRFLPTTPVEYDPQDLFLPEIAMSAKRLREYILAQEPYLDDECRMTGQMRFDGSVEGNIFERTGHRRFNEVREAFFLKPIDGLVIFEWQHAHPAFAKIIREGIVGVLKNIETSRENHTQPEELAFLDALEIACDAITGWAEKCSASALRKAGGEADPIRAAQMEELGEALQRVPRYPAESFFEAVLCLYLCYSFLPDSIGSVDRYLYPYYKSDRDSGRLTDEEAKELLQELFLRIQAHTSRDGAFTRGAQCHFCVGGYTQEGEDGFNEFSRLIVESLIELPTWIPQVSFRWTKKTPFEALRFMLDCERKDKNKRIAFISDEPRIKALTEIAGLDYKLAVDYSLTGCNELAVPGALYMGSCANNIARSLTNTLYLCREEAVRCEDFDAFYALYERELYKDLAVQLDFDYKFNRERAKDTNIISSIFLTGCVERAKSATQGGCSVSVNVMPEIGAVTVIDSLSIIKQFVYDEKTVSMEALLSALAVNWEGHAALRSRILNTGRFFGNNDSLSNDIARRFFDSLHRYLDGKRDQFGNPFLLSNINGYIPNNSIFGKITEATPDGRRRGDALTNGIQQTLGRDREGLTPLLTSVGQADPRGLFSAGSVTNIMLDGKLIWEEANFEKTARILETFFKLGGQQLQLNYVSLDDLKRAKESPEEYKSLRVRVSGFSDFFVVLEEAIQDDIMERTRIGA